MAKPPRGEGKSFNAPATCTNHSVSQQRLGMGKERYNFPSPNPLWRPTRIRIKSPGDDVDLIARGAHGWVVTGAHGGGPSITIKTLSEWDSRRSNGAAWHQKLQSQPGAALPPAELKNNSYKLSRWTCWALLARSEDRKLGYLSWNHEKDFSHHVILGTQQCPPHECASQSHLSREDAWGMLTAPPLLHEAGGGPVPRPPGPQQVGHSGLWDNEDEGEDGEEEEEEEETSQRVMWSWRL
uniref:Uncharacterized protein n=1 Tax=Myotis myotis TaxID=51298 RepID=A0A7J7V3Z1_MYOMY|nr:hypothetical protein mMyoMyo1_008445 [Myotis myotis]